MGKLYDIFARSSNRKDKGIKKEDVKIDPKYGFAFFFRLTWRRIGKIATVNLLFVMLGLPIIMFLIGYSGWASEEYRIPQSQMYPILAGVASYKSGPVIDAMYGIYGATTATYADTALSLALKWAGGLLWVFSFGFANVGTTYLLRGMVRGQNLFMWSDFWDSIKKNLKQGFIMGIIDVLLIYVLIYDIISYNANAYNFIYNLFFFMSIAIMLIYFIMRFYIYTLIITFDLPLRKILKNSFILAMAGFKRNICALIGIIITVVINYFMIALNVTTSIGIMLPFIFTYGFCAFLSMYCSYPVIKRIMIDPYYKEHTDEKDPTEEEPEDEEEEPIFTDRG